MITILIISGIIFLTTFLNSDRLELERRIERQEEEYEALLLKKDAEIEEWKYLAEIRK